MNIYPADILCVGGKGWISNQIKKATHSPISHSGLILANDPTFVIEAEFKVITRPLDESIAGMECAYILHNRKLSPAQRDTILNRASGFSTDDYGILDIGLQLLDCTFHTRWFTDKLTFGLLNRFPICSYVVAESYKSAGELFGFEARSITPGDLFTFAVDHPQIYTVTRLI